jgi:hypothetical protein
MVTDIITIVKNRTLLDIIIQIFGYKHMIYVGISLVSFISVVDTLFESEIGETHIIVNEKFVYKGTAARERTNPVPGVIKL